MEPLLDHLLHTGSLRLQADGPITDGQLQDLSRTYKPYRFELTPEQSLIIMSPVGTDYAESAFEIATILKLWAKHYGGHAYGSDAGFRLPDGSVRSPDVAWVAPGRIPAGRRMRGFRQLCPDFVIEVMSPNDRLSGGDDHDLLAKMQMWLANGIRLGWLIDLDNETTYIFRPGQAVETLPGFDRTLGGEDVLPGFELALASLKA